MTVKEADRTSQDPARIGESVVAALYSSLDGNDEDVDPMAVWSQVLTLAGVTQPRRVLGWVPVFQCDSDSEEDVARAKEASRLVADVASISATDSADDDQYWLNTDAIWTHIQAHKNSKSAT